MNHRDWRPTINVGSTITRKTRLCKTCVEVP